MRDSRNAAQTRRHQTTHRRLLVIALIASWATPLMAQENPVSAEPADTEAQDGPLQDNTKTYQIPAGALGVALNRLAQQANVAISVNGNDVAGLNAPALVGRYTLENAFAVLLAGSSLRAERTESGYVVRRPPADVMMTDAVKIRGEGLEASAVGPVMGYVARQSATATKTSTPIQETPQSISVVTRDQIDVRGAQSLTDALKYSAGLVTGHRGESNSLGTDNIIIRGFGDNGVANEYWDGLQIIGTNFASSGIDPYLFERIEVLRGPASVLYGQNQPGGIVNSVSKRPTTEPQGDLQVFGGSFNAKGANLDIAGPVDEEGAVLYRVIGAYTDKEGQADFVARERSVFSPSVTWRPTSDTTFTLQYVYQKDDASGGVVRYLPAEGTLFDSPNGQLPRERTTAEPNYDQWDREVSSVAYFLEHRLNEGWSARQNFRYLATEIDTKMVYSLSFKDIETVDPDTQEVTTAASDRIVRRSAFGLSEASDLFVVDGQLEGQFTLGGLRHKVLFGVDVQHHDGSTRRYFGSSEALDFDLYAPVYNIDVPEPNLFRDLEDDQRSTGIYVQDQVKYNKWILTLGLRYDRTKSEETYKLFDTTLKEKESALSSRFGLGYDFDSGVTSYISFSESFEPTPGTDFFGNGFEPTEGEQYEAGIKYDPPGANALLTLSVFELTQQNVLTPDPDPEHTGSSVQTGEIRSRGLELEGSASLRQGWDIVGSFSYLDQEVTKSNGTDLGKRIAAIPRHRAALWSNYTLTQGPATGLAVGAGVSYNGSTQGDSENTFSVDAYTLLDAAINYDLSALGHHWSGWTLALNATNLTDKTYVAGCYSSARCYYGLGRELTARIGYTW